MELESRMPPPLGLRASQFLHLPGDLVVLLICPILLGEAALALSLSTASTWCISWLAGLGGEAVAVVGSIAYLSL